MLARLLLSWLCSAGRHTEQGIHPPVALGHMAEIAQMIGVTRETVTRLLGEMRSKGVIQLKGFVPVIKDIEALEGMVSP